MQIINIDLIPGKVMPVLHSSQYDKGRELGVKLYNGGAVFTLSGAETVTVSVRKPDGNIVIETLTNTGTNELTIITTEQMTACHGSNLCEIKIEDGADVIGTANFVLEVEKDPTEGGIASASEIDNLEAQVAAIVADQYDSANVVFDATPTAGHGVGFAVTSEGVKNAIPDDLDDLSDVTYTGTPAMGEAVVWDGSKWTNGTPDMDVSDLADVTITTPSDDDILVYQNGEWVNMANPASTANFGPDYDENTTYNTGDKCVYNNLLYECNDDGVTGAWDATKWDRLTVASMTDNNLPHYTGTPTAGTTAEAIGDLTTLTTTDKSSLVGAVNEVNRKTKSIYSNSTYSNQLGTAITTTDNMGDFRFLRITIGVSSFDSWNMTYILIPNCKGSTTGYYQFASNNVGGKIIRLSTDTTTTLTLISSSEASICVSQVVGIY